MEGGLKLISNCISVVTIAACCLQKIPQIMNIYEKKSSVGINLTAPLLQLLSYTITALYNYSNGYSLLTYLEYPILLGQEMIMIFLVIKYSGRLNEQSTRFCVLCYGLIVLAFFVQVFPSPVLKFLVPLCIPVSGASKIMYIYAMIQAQSAETTSLLTWVISAATNVSRIFTVFLDSDDHYLLTNFFISMGLSLSVLLTAIYYKSKHPATPHLPEGSALDRHSSLLTSAMSPQKTSRKTRRSEKQRKQGTT